jgi:hypothetical protein
MTTALQYAKIKANSEKYAKEKQRLNEYNKSKYRSDESYRLRALEYQKNRREQLKINNTHT